MPYYFIPPEALEGPSLKREPGPGMLRHELWREMYRADRYMAHLTADQLEQRAADEISNIGVITDEGKLGAQRLEELVPWLIRWTHVLEEFRLRYGPPPAGFNGFIKRAHFPDPRSPAAQKAGRLVANRSPVPGTYLVRYGKREHLQEALHKGRIRIAPASSYNDPSLNAAIKDDELTLWVQPPPEVLTIDVQGHETGMAKGRIRPIDNRLVARASTDYYVLCLSSSLAARLFVDFRADACLLITGIEFFSDALLAAFAQVHPGWAGGVESVRYYDPIKSPFTKLEMYVSKHFRYWHQREIRVLWLPPKPRYDLQPFFVELGSLEGCSELLTLDE